jgi:hypothetical protein
MPEEKSGSKPGKERVQLSILNCRLCCRRMKARLIIFLLLCFFILAICGETKAQFSSSRCKWVRTDKKAFTPDTLSLQPGTLKVSFPENSAIKIAYDINTNQALIQGDLLPDSIRICYKVFPINFSKPYFKRDISLYDSNQIYNENALYPVAKEEREEMFSTPGINKSGVITRGITVGNTQNVFVNSSLNLQLEGKISEDINMVAAISDQNVPFQPEGNTQTINEFDKVFIKFYNSKGSLTAGDLVMQNKPSNFLRYYRNVQGGQFELYSKRNEKIFSTTTVSAAVSKGKFASLNIEPGEGVQGPYRLKVSDTERFIIILANSEKVFVDGKLLKRGYNYDYVIDYNQAEITFTSAVLITRYTRIRVDIEYAERNYSRSIVNASHVQTVGKAEFSFQYFNQKDNPRNPLLLDLSESDKQLLSEVGDSLSQALALTVDSVAFDINKVLYKKVDTTTTSGSYTAYVYSINPENAFYELSFSEVGNNKGDYILSSSTTNGRVFTWVAPENGVRQGNYAPVQLLPTPTKLQMITLGGAYNFSKADKIYFEGALSNKDINLYSSKNDKDNTGQAIKVGYENTGRKIIFLKDYNWTSVIDYEFNSKTFNPVDRFRGIEFNRDWSVALDEELYADENIFNAGAGIIKNNLNRVEYKFTRRVRGNFVNGNQHKASLYKKINNITLKSDYFNLISHRPEYISYWQRLTADVSYSNRYIVPGYVYQLDKNSIRFNNIDSVNTAMNFDEHKVYLQSPDSSSFKFLIDYSNRVNNYAVPGGEFKKGDRVQMSNFGLGKVFGENNFNVTFTYRNLENFIRIENGRREETVMMRLDHNQYLLKKNIRSELTYYTFTGRELQREFIYLTVPTGQGTHTWRDENGDGVKDLNEFYEAINPDEKNYVKFFVPTDTYLQAYTSNFNYRLNMLTPSKWRSATGLKKLFSYFSVISSWTIEKKTTSDNIEARLLPFVTEVLNANIISYRESLRSTLFYNKTNSTYGADLSYNATKYKQPLTNGYELRKKDEYRANGRLNLSNSVNTRMGVIYNQTQASSDYLTSRNFLIDSYKVSPEISFQPKNNFRITGSYVYTFKDNVSIKEKNDIAIYNEYSVDVKWAKLSNRTLQAVFRYTNIDYDGEINSATGYEMLEALRPGGNLNWSFNLLQKLSNGLQLSINYEGRKSEALRIIHLGRMQLSALF